MQRAVRLPLPRAIVPEGELRELLASESLWRHRLGDGTWWIAREHREIGSLASYPKIVELANTIPAERKQIWISVLHAHGNIRPHVDSERSGACRIHVPLVGEGLFNVDEDDLGNPGRSPIDYRSYEMKVGEFWAVDTVGRMHGARNDHDVDRVHMLVDVLPSPWLREHVPWL